jgi:hypothetical protein
MAITIFDEYPDGSVSVLHYGSEVPQISGHFSSWEEHDQLNEIGKFKPIAAQEAEIATLGLRSRLARLLGGTK